MDDKLSDHLFASLDAMITNASDMRSLSDMGIFFASPKMCKSLSDNEKVSVAEALERKEIVVEGMEKGFGKAYAEGELIFKRIHINIPLAEMDGNVGSIKKLLRWYIYEKGKERDESSYLQVELEKAQSLVESLTRKFSSKNHGVGRK
jgi:hypothetical protein